MVLVGQVAVELESQTMMEAVVVTEGAMVQMAKLDIILARRPVEKAREPQLEPLGNLIKPCILVAVVEAAGMNILQELGAVELAVMEQARKQSHQVQSNRLQTAIQTPEVAAEGAKCIAILLSLQGQVPAVLV